MELTYTRTGMNCSQLSRGTFAQIAKSAFEFHRACPSAYPHVGARHPLDRFLWNLISGYFYENLSTLNLVKIGLGTLHEDLIMFLLLRAERNILQLDNGTEVPIVAFP